MQFLCSKGRQKIATRFSGDPTAGFSLVEIIVVAAITALVFSGLFAGLQLMLNVIGNTKAEAGARLLAVERMEYIRSLPYEDVGTIGGLGPQGSIPQVSTTTLNSVTYTERVFIAFLDRPEDGFGFADNTIPGVPADSNGIDQDSKVIKVEYTWNIRGTDKSLTLISDVVPKGIESTAGGGTILIHVFDAAVQPVPGATVRVFNDLLATTTDVTVTTNANGIANFPGAPAGGGYQISVTRSGYSSDQTYSASATNTSPNPPHVAVVEGDVSTVNFAIDEVSDLTIRTISTPVTGVFSDSFDSVAQIGSSTDVTVSGGALILAGSGNYADSGIAYASTSAPDTISSWQSFDFNGTTTENSAFRLHVYVVSGSGTSTEYDLIPDTDLPLNSTGFITGPVDITSIDPDTYPYITIGATLTTNDSSETPAVFDWSLTHIESESPINGLDFTVESNKTIGDVSGVPVLKYTADVTTSGDGEAALTNLEWDAYDIVFNGASQGYDIKEAYAPLPYALEPGVSDTLTLVMEPHDPYTLRVTVFDTLGSVIPGATVQLQNGAVDQSLDTSIYGQVFFGNLASATDYTVTASAEGYDPSTQSNVSVTGTTQLQMILPVEGSGTGTTTPPAATSSSTFLAGYTERIPLSIAGTSLFGSVSDFPVYIDLADMPAAFFAAVQSTGGDIRITTADGLSEVPREVVSIDTGAESGQLHFKAPSLLTSTTSVFYLYYGSSTAPTYADSATFGAENVWSNDYQAVYHLEESSSGSGNIGVYQDATSNNADGDDYIRATDKGGKIGLGQMFEEEDTDFIEIPHTVLDGLSNLTLSFWYRSNNNNHRTILSGAKNNTSDGANEYLFWFRDNNEIEFFSHGDPRVRFGITNVNDDNWRYYTSVRDDSNNQTLLYVNGAADNENPESDSMTTLDIASGGLFIGADQDSVGGSFGQYLDDNIDEIRISTGVRDSGWIANEYSNQNSPSLFYGVGTIETE